MEKKYDTVPTKGGALDAIKNIYNNRVKSGTFSDGGKYGNADLGIGIAGYSSNDTLGDRVYFNGKNNDLGSWAGRYNNEGRNNYYAGTTLPNALNPLQDGYKYKDVQTPIGNFEFGNEAGDVYASYESPLERTNSFLDDGTFVKNNIYNSPNGYAYANKETYPDGNVGFTMGYSRNGVNSPETWNERETPLGTIGYGNNGSGYSAFYEPNQNIQDTYNKFLQMLSGLRR